MAPDFDRLARIPCPIASLASSGIKAFNSALDRSCSRKACRVRRKRPANSPGDRPTASRRRARVAAIPGCSRKFSRLPPGAGDTADPTEKQATGAARALNSIRSKRKPNAQDPLIRGKAQRHQTHPRSISQNQSLPKNSAKSLPACSSRWRPSMSDARAYFASPRRDVRNYQRCATLALHACRLCSRQSNIAVPSDPC